MGVNFNSFIISVIGIKKFISLIFLSLISILLDLSGVYLFYKLSDSIITQSSLKILFFDIGLNPKLILGIFIYYTSRFLIITIINYYQVNCFYFFQKEVSSIVLKKLLNSSYDKFFSKKSSYYYNFFSRDIEALTSSLQATLFSYLDIITSVSLIFVGLVLNFYLNLTIYLTLFTFSGLYYLLVLKKYRFYGIQKVNAEQLKLGYVENAVNGFKEIKLNNLSDFFLSKFDIQNNLSSKMGRSYQFLQLLPKSLFETIGFLLILSILIFSFTPESLISDIGLVGISLFKILPSINRLINYRHAIKYSQKSFENLKEIL